MLVSGVIATTLLVGAMLVLLFAGFAMIGLDRQREQTRFTS